ncbi:MAG: hypothetical protein FJ202_07050 [Gemmatimonadetes bacterium]|nr:hypothetical protein [Gemmatimonadota bacterium]
MRLAAIIVSAGVGAAGCGGDSGSAAGGAAASGATGGASAVDSSAMAAPGGAAAGGAAAIVAAPEPAKPVDLSNLKANIPKASSETFTFRPLKVEQIADAPPALMDAAEREQGISRFCYQEFGQKVDPKLIGAVALVVTVRANAIVDIRIGADDWSSSVGRAVDRCLIQKTPQAWKLLPDARVADGRYVVQLQFRPS